MSLVTPAVSLAETQIAVSSAYMFNRAGTKIKQLASDDNDQNDMITYI